MSEGPADQHVYAPLVRGRPPTSSTTDPAGATELQTFRARGAPALVRPRAKRLLSVPEVHYRKEMIQIMSETEQKAWLAGGCFWGMQELIRKLPGVLSTRVGYSGGGTPLYPTYRDHGSHAESIEIVFDPAATDYRIILEYFFQIHDPTTKHRQGNDIGASYRSAVFYLDDEQRRIAQETIADVDASGLWPGKVVTEVVPADEFWEAESEHQDYLERYPEGYTCHFPRPNWRLPKRAEA